MIDEIKQLHIIADPKNKWLFKVLGMINIDPLNATFATQNKDEEVIIVLRKHIINNLPWMLTTILLFLLPLIFYGALSLYDHFMNSDALLQGAVLSGFNQSYILPLVLFYLLMIVSYAYFKFVHWYFDIFIITNERYISIDFDILRGRTITDIPLTDIIDISEKVLGVFPTIFGYGNIEFKTTSEKLSIVENVPQTVWIRDSLGDLIKYIRHVKVVKSKDNTKTDIVVKKDKNNKNDKEEKSQEETPKKEKINPMNPSLITDIVGTAMANKEKKKGGQLSNNNQTKEP
jgi:hypothetical protein